MTQYSLNKLWNSTLIRKQNQEGLQHIYQDQRKVWWLNCEITMKKIIWSLWDHCEENHQLDGCLKFMDMALKDRINFLSKKNTVLNVYNQWSHNIMSRLVIKDWTVEPAVVVIQQLYMVMCQKGKMMLKMIKGGLKMMSLLPIALLTLRLFPL